MIRTNNSARNKLEKLNCSVFDFQLDALRGESLRSGVPVAHMVRRALDSFLAAVKEAK